MAPKRNFVKENVKRVQEQSRRSTTPNGNTSITFKRPSTSSNNTKSRTVSSRVGPKKSTITIIKAAPEVFPKSNSDESLASSSTTNSDPDVVVERPASATLSEKSTTREMSIQTIDPKDDSFMVDAVIRHPSASVVEKLAENMHSMKLRTEKERQRYRRSLGLDDEELGGNNRDTVESVEDFDVTRAKFLDNLVSFNNTGTIKHKPKTQEIWLSDLEQKRLQAVLELNKERSKRLHSQTKV